jgi:hypothetical protein
MPDDQICEGCNDEPAQVWDHDHKNLNHRGWLCRRCNFALGHAQNDIQRLQNLAAYLKKYTNGNQI